MEPPRKRVCLEPISDPSSRMQDGSSPFCQSSSDCVREIFRRLLWNPKQKMKLELVCRRFKDELQWPDSWKKHLILTGFPVKLDDDDSYGSSPIPSVIWSRDDSLQLFGFPQYVYINGVKFCGDQIARALCVFVEKIQIHRITVENTVRLERRFVQQIEHVLSEHCDRFQLQTISIRNVSLSVDYFLRMITDAFTHFRLTGVASVRIVETDSHIFNQEQVPYFDEFVWPTVEKCLNLVRLVVYSDRNIDVDQMCQRVGHCDYIKSILINSTDRYYVNFSEHDAQKVDQIGDLCSSLKHLSSIELGFRMDDPSRFINRLDDDCRSRMREFLCVANGTADDLNNIDQIVQSIHDFFPNISNYLIDVLE